MSLTFHYFPLFPSHGGGRRSGRGGDVVGVERKRGHVPPLLHERRGKERKKGKYAWMGCGGRWPVGRLEKDAMEIHQNPSYAYVIRMFHVLHMCLRNAVRDLSSAQGALPLRLPFLSNGPFKLRSKLPGLQIVIYSKSVPPGEKRKEQNSILFVQICSTELYFLRLQKDTVVKCGFHPRSVRLFACLSNPSVRFLFSRWRNDFAAAALSVHDDDCGGLRAIKFLLLISSLVWYEDREAWGEWGLPSLLLGCKRARRQANPPFEAFRHWMSEG